MSLLFHVLPVTKLDQTRRVSPLQTGDLEQKELDDQLSHVSVILWWFYWWLVHTHTTHIYTYWLVVSTPLKNISQCLKKMFETTNQHNMCTAPCQSALHSTLDSTKGCATEHPFTVRFGLETMKTPSRKIRKMTAFWKVQQDEGLPSGKLT